MRVLPLFALVFLCPQLPSQDASDFQQVLARVRGMMERGRWRAARDALFALLEAHAGTRHARARRTEIVEDFTRCSFELEFPASSGADDAVSADVLSFDRRTGRIKLRYRSEKLDDIDQSTGLHPMLFTGPYSVSVRGDSLRSSVVFGVLGGADGVRVEAKPGRRGRLELSLSSREHDDSDILTGLRTDRRWTLEADVTRSRVHLSFNGRRVASIPKPSEAWGQVWLRPGTFDVAVLEGLASPAWLQGRIDAHRAAQRAKFDAAFDPRAELPPWLFEIAPDAPDRTVTLPDPVPDSLAPRFRSALELATGDEPWRALEILDELDPEVLPDSVAYLRGLVELRRGSAWRALAPARTLVERRPDYLDGQVLLADVERELGRGDAALERYLLVLEREPGYTMAVVPAVGLLLRRAQRERAEAVIAAAREAGVHGEDIDRIEQTLVLARRGPAWSRVYEFRSRHYEVTSDIDRRTCFEAAQVLEAAYRLFQQDLGWLRDDDDEPRFRVFLFAGEAGYRDYCTAIFGAALPHTAGLYTPELQQLLIWNLPDREAMMRTVRHEGFHQYLDRVVPAAPVWLNEGLAEFYEHAERDRGGSLRGGVVQETHRRVLLSHPRGPVPLRSLLRMEPAEFRRDMARHYAQSWALVHMLRTGDADQRALFDAVFTAYRDAPDAETAFERAFEGVDLDELAGALEQHVRDL